ncbi:MAG: hypothetical protein JW913_07890 [Chitinispirillaceae bacterium]|nr:hypothetical protein [Chitinispirillaceae bacterium]
MLMNPLLAIMLVTSLIGAIFLFTGLHAIKKLQLFRAFRHGMIMVICLSITVLSGVLIIANHGYRNLTREELAATVVVEPAGKQQFNARFTLPDSTVSLFTIAGDLLYVDAHILKWHPLLNLLGVHTTYELDRVGGRYHSLGDEQTRPRTVYSLSKTRVLNMYHLRRRLAALKPLLDAEYGSATFTQAEKAATLRIMVSTSGLLVREGK